MNRPLHISLATLVLGFLAGCAPEPEASPVKPQEPGLFASRKCIGSESGGQYLCYVSIVDLIANPALFEGKKVMVQGYVHLGLEDNAIYLHKDDSVHDLFKNGLWLDVPDGFDSAACQDRYALVEGTFKGGPGGHLGSWSGTLEDITTCKITGLNQQR
jgi:hypothetical protein